MRWLVLTVVTPVAAASRGRDTTTTTAPRPRRWRPRPNTLIRLLALGGASRSSPSRGSSSDLIESLTIKLAYARPGELAPLVPDNDVQRVLYRRSLEVTLLVIGIGLYQAFRMKRASGERLDVAATAWAVGVLWIALLMTVIPFRITLQNDRYVRAQYDDMRCYVLGEAGGPCSSIVLIHRFPTPGPYRPTTSACGSKAFTKASSHPVTRRHRHQPSDISQRRSTCDVIVS